MLTKSQKRYLFAIYRLGQNGRPVKSTEVASVLGVTKASTVKMTQKLIDEGYIIKEPYREITLTSEGIKAANELYTPIFLKTVWALREKMPRMTRWLLFLRYLMTLSTSL